MGSLLELVSTKMKPTADKATLADMVIARSKMPETLSDPDMTVVPDCMFTETGAIHPDRLTILAWVQLKREKQDITEDQVAEMINWGDSDTIMDFIKCIYWFWSELEESVFEKRWAKRMERLKELSLEDEITPVEDMQEQEVAPENPTPSENS